jgi:uncharacterized protein
MNARARELRAALRDLPRQVIRAPLAEVRAAEVSDSDVLRVTGHASVFDSWSEPIGGFGYSFRERVARGAFRKLLADDPDTVFTVGHQIEGVMPMARTTAGTLRLREDPVGLRIDADLDAGRADVQTLRSALERGEVSQMSIGFTVDEDEWVIRTGEDDEEEVERTIISFRELFDVSAVTRPAFTDTEIGIRAQIDERLTRALTKSGADHTPSGEDPEPELDDEGDGSAPDAAAGEGHQSDPPAGDETGDEGRAAVASASRARRLTLLGLATPARTHTNKENT